MAGLQLSAHSVSSLLARIFGPSFYDDPRFGNGDPGHGILIHLVSDPSPQPWHAVMLNPQPLPPAERFALALADAHVRELLTIDRLSLLLGGETTERVQKQALRTIAEIDELCPRWPRWPKTWPPPPPPPWQRDDMTATELFVFGSRVLAATDMMEQGELQDALTRLGEKALGLSMPE